MFLKQALILLVIHRILSTESLGLLQENCEGIDFDIEKNLTLASNTEEDYVLQKLDHFTPTDNRTWNQKYYFDQSCYEKGGPVYLLFGGVNSRNGELLQLLSYRKHGEKNKAMFFMIEHRYYDESQPLNVTSTEDLRYLTISQALADAASFIEAMNERHGFPRETKWITFGCFYAGSLAAWMRLKYPHLVHAAVASSAPISIKMEYPEIYDTFSEALESYNPQCTQDIATASAELDKMVNTTEGRKKIGEIIELCHPLSNSSIDSTFFLVNMARYFVSFSRNNLTKVCEKMLENADYLNPLQRFAKVLKMVLKIKGCLEDNYTAHIESQKSDKSASQYRQLYQSCTEYPNFGIPSEKNNIFTKRWTVGYELDQCSKIFSPLFTEKFVRQETHYTNLFFGGLKINVPRIVFIHGTADYFHNLGVLPSNKMSNVEAILIEGGKQCADLYENEAKYSMKVKDARIQVENSIDSWLKQKL